MGESLGLGKQSSGPETDTYAWSWFRLPIPKPSFGRTLPTVDFQMTPSPFFLVCVVIEWPLSTTFNLKVNCNFQLVTLFRVIGPWIFLHHNCTINATNYPIRRKNCVVIFSTRLGTYIEITARTWQLQSGLQSGFFPEVWRQIFLVAHYIGMLRNS